MFENVGGSIKVLAKVLCCLGIIGSIIAGIVTVSQASNTNYNGEFYKILGYIFVIVGPILSWISTLLLYGFGELVENSTIIAEQYLDELDLEDDENDE